MRQDELSPATGSKHVRKRVGRGDGSGHGTYSGKGCKGQKSRSSVELPRGFEGGQLPIAQKLPHKRGFHNKFGINYATINIRQLAEFEAGNEVNAEKVFTAGMTISPKLPLKILGDGEIDHALTVKANKFSATAKAKIEAAGGKVQEEGNARDEAA